MVLAANILGLVCCVARQGGWQCLSLIAEPVPNSVSTSEQVYGRDLCIFSVILVTAEIMVCGCPLLRLLCLSSSEEFKTH